MVNQSRRDLITQGLVKLPDCSLELSGITLENNETPFFEHFHVLHIPLKTLQRPPVGGVQLTTSSMDIGSYDVLGFKRFVQQTGLDPRALSKHSHEVKISQSQLQRIAKGEKNVEVRVVSANGNYVHNFLISALPGVLASVRNLKG